MTATCLAALCALSSLPDLARSQEEEPEDPVDPVLARAPETMSLDLVTEYFSLEYYLLSVAIWDEGKGPYTPCHWGLRAWTTQWSIASGESHDLMFSWTPLALFGGFHCLFGGPSVQGYVGTEPGLVLRLGAGRNFQLGLSAGVGSGLTLFTAHMFADYPDEVGGWGFLLSPSFRFRYQSDGTFSCGAGLRALVPLHPDSDFDFYGATLNVFFEIGFSDWVAARSAQLARPWQDQWGHAAFWSGFALLGVGAMSTAMANDAGDDGIDPGEPWAGGMYAGYLLGGGLVLAGIVLWALAPEHQGLELDPEKAMDDADDSRPRSAIARLTEQAGLDSTAFGTTEPVSAPLSGQAKWGHAAFWTGLALTGFGGVATWQATEAAAADEGDNIRLWAGGMYAGFITGGLLMATGIVLWALDPGTETE